VIRDYISIARPSHWSKNAFMLPGVLLGWLACQPENPLRALVSIGLGLAAVCLLCSSNYTINEWLDAPGDRKHPDKKDRAAAAGSIRGPIAYAQWLFLGAAGLLLAWMVSLPFFVTGLALLLMGLAYNVKPMRLKEWPYLDVLAEAVNNPLRFLLGWYAVPCLLVPPASVLLSYWMMGAYFMAIKRLAEMRRIGDPAVAGAYRWSFKYYTPERLYISIMFYATAFAFFGGVFLDRYRIELILAVPFLAGFMAVYLWLGLLPNSPAQHPERLYRNWFFTAYACLTALVVVGCLLVRLPWLDDIFQATIPSGP